MADHSAALCERRTDRRYDIIDQMFNSGELHQVLGVPAPVRITPALHITPAAAKAIRLQAMENTEPGYALHLSVDARYQSQFQLKPLSGNEIMSEVEGIKVYFDLASAPRADGISIDWIEDARGSVPAIDNPNAPAKVQSLSVEALNGDLQNFVVIDVRPTHGREVATFPHPHEVLDEDGLNGLPLFPRTPVLHSSATMAIPADRPQSIFVIWATRIFSMSKAALMPGPKKLTTRYNAIDWRRAFTLNLA